VAEQRHAKTRASLGSAIVSWLETHELEESTRESSPTRTAPHCAVPHGCRADQ
jgi:hypothetical protein